MVSSTIEERWRQDFCVALADLWPTESALRIRVLADSAPQRWTRLTPAEAAFDAFDGWGHLIEAEATLLSGARDDVSGPTKNV